MYPALPIVSADPILPYRKNRHRVNSRITIDAGDGSRAKFSFAHGGKDSYPYPVDHAAYDQTTDILELAIKEAKLGREEKLQALRRLQYLLNPASANSPKK